MQRAGGGGAEPALAFRFFFDLTPAVGGICASPPELPVDFSLDFSVSKSCR